VDLIIQVTTVLQPPHPIHKHSNKHFLIGQGNGVFNWTSVAQAVQESPGSFNLATPQIRDTSVTLALITGPTWMALRYQVVNPGAFLMHCHIQVHQSGGMVLAILDGVDAWPTIPPRYLNDSGF
jgi:FtsP/CotA-like multicopper oxidase with cupredoxin domain